jgi:hypothetical protein
VKRLERMLLTVQQRWAELFQSRINADCVYKYLEPQWADAMVQRGAMRIGTLNLYRNLEASDTERGDIGEGTRTLHSDDRPRVYNSKAELPPVLQGLSCGPGGLATNGANAIVIENRVQDMYVYCVTAEFDPRVMRTFGGACVRIEQPVEFFAAVNLAFRSHLHNLSLHVLEGAVDHCVYASRSQNYHDNIPVHECLLKPQRYQHQRELRAIWRPDALPIGPIAFDCPNASQYCTRQE